MLYWIRKDLHKSFPSLHEGRLKPDLIIYDVLVALNEIERATHDKWAPRRSPKMVQEIEEWVRKNIDEVTMSVEEEDVLDEVEIARLQHLAEHPELEDYWMANAGRKRTRSQ